MQARILFASLFLCASLEAQVTNIVNGASFRSDQPVTTGSWATAFGAFSGVSATTAPSYPLPTTLGGVTVTVDGVSAPLYFVGPTQLNFVTPTSLTPGLKTVQVKTASATLSSSIRIISSAPGIFTKDQATPPKGAVRNQDASENTQSAPAHRGDVISIYGTGPGAFVQTVTDGAAAPSAPLTVTKSTPQVFIDGVEATVQFSGLNPGNAALWQVNATIPSNSFITGRVPVRIFVDGVDSNEVTIFVQ
jgi:uncharacterized protein (TIGR03437 family)